MGSQSSCLDLRRLWSGCKQTHKAAAAAAQFAVITLRWSWQWRNMLQCSAGLRTQE
jgi:hypothetical protein